MTLKLIKEAQTVAKLGDKVEVVNEVKHVLGVSLTEAAEILGEMNDFGVQPNQIVDQIVNYLAPEAGINPRFMTAQQFSKLAQRLRIELEDHYDETYSNAEWKQKVSAAFQMLSSTGQEDEETGWPSDNERPTINDYPSDEEQFDFDDQSDDDYTDYSMRQGEMGNPNRRWDRTNPEYEPNEYGNPEENEEFADQDVVATVRNLLDQGAHVQSGIAGGMGQILDIDDRGVATIQIRGRRGKGVMNISNVPGGLEIVQRNGAYVVRNAGLYSEENEEHGMSQRDFGPTGRGSASAYSSGRQSGGDRSDANRGVNAAFRGDPFDPSESADWKRGYSAYCAANNIRIPKMPSVSPASEENEEMTKKASMLADLLNQKKTVQQQANEIAKSIEDQGAKAFQDHIVNSPKSPFDPKKDADSHKKWLNGFMKAAQSYYSPVDNQFTKKSAKAKPKK
jgi:hypothetical protein